jgi:hypothetical protein
LGVAGAQQHLVYVLATALPVGRVEHLSWQRGEFEPVHPSPGFVEGFPKSKQVCSLVTGTLNWLKSFGSAKIIFRPRLADQAVVTQAWFPLNKNHITRLNISMNQTGLVEDTQSGRQP